MSFRDKVKNSPWLDEKLVELKIAENAKKAEADRELAKQMLVISKNHTRSAIARVAK